MIFTICALHPLTYYKYTDTHTPFVHSSSVPRDSDEDEATDSYLLSCVLLSFQPGVLRWWVGHHSSQRQVVVVVEWVFRPRRTRSDHHATAVVGGSVGDANFVNKIFLLHIRNTWTHTHTSYTYNNWWRGCGWVDDRDGGGDDQLIDWLIDNNNYLLPSLYGYIMYIVVRIMCVAQHIAAKEEEEEGVEEEGLVTLYKNVHV